MPTDTPDTIVVNLTRHEMTPGIRSFLAEYKAMTFDHPFDPRERVWSYASDNGERLPLITTALSFTPYHAAPVWFQTISSPDVRGKGQASYVLREITRLADKHGVAIWLTPKPFGKFDNALKMSDLKAWYTRHGWVRQGSDWVRHPTTSRVASREFRRTRTAATVTVDKAHVNALRKDVLMIARAADNVDSIEDIDQVTQAIRTWRNQWDMFASTLRQDLEDRVRAANNPYSTKYNANPPIKEDAEYYLDSALSPMWEFNTELNRNPRMDTDLKDVYGNPWKPPEEAFEATVRLYLEHGNAKSREDAIREAQRYHERRPLATRAEAEAAVVARWKDEAVKWTRRLRDKARKAWDTLNRYVEWLESWRGGKRPLEVIHPDEEVVPLAGFRVIFRGFAESPYKDELEALRVGLERYRKAAAARAPLLLKMTPPIFIEWTFEPTSSSNAAAYYTHNRVNITPWVIGKDIDRFVKTLAHEVGHHLFRMYLAKDAMDAWAQFIRNDYRDLDLREALAVMDKVGARSIIDESLMMEDPILHIQLSTLMHDPGYSRVADWLFASGIRKYLDAGGNPILRVPTNPITGYAGKNSDEAFCEALGNLVGYGPKAVPDVVLKMLRSVLGDGVRVASRVAAAWLTRTASGVSGFHGWGMSPEAMRLDGPQFTDQKPIPPEDIESAADYLKEVRPGLLVAYSRGGAVAMLSIRESGVRPKVIWVAPAWKRGWASVTPPSVSGVILHGDQDNAVPLQHSCQLADRTGLPLRVVPGRNHINILKDKTNPSAGSPVPQDKVRECIDTLPDWGSSAKGSPGDIAKQEEFARSLTAARRKRPATGDCYEAAGRYIMDNYDPNLRLVHGEVAGQGPLEGTTFGHAWILDGDMVIDRSNGRDIRVPKVVYYAMGAVDQINNVHEYTQKQALQQMVRHEHFGPWDLKTRSGL